MSANDKQRDWLRLDDHLPASARKTETVEEDGTPEAEFGGGYEPCGIVGQGKALMRLHIIRDPKPRVTMQYPSMDAYSEYEPGRFVLYFAGAAARWRVTVMGRNLWRIYDACTRHAPNWIRQAPRDFEERPGQAVITKIDVEEVGEEP